jgi:hypothetical protein
MPKALVITIQGLRKPTLLHLTREVALPKDRRFSHPARPHQQPIMKGKRPPLRQLAAETEAVAIMHGPEAVAMATERREIQVE